MSQENKTYYSWTDFKEDVSYFQALVEMNKCNRIVTLYRGGMTLAHKLSSITNLPISIIDYQSYDGKSKRVKWYAKYTIKKNDKIILIDDIADSGNSIIQATKFLNELGYTDITVATIHGNSGFKTKYGWNYCKEHNKEWIVYPWE